MDLTFVPIQDIYDELLKRFDCVVLGAMKKEKEGEGFKISRRYKGDYHLGLGLCKDIENGIIKQLEDDRVQIKTEDL